ncbi:MAG TPA: signal peptidase I [Tepidiformaceae bacterium]
MDPARLGWAPPGTYQPPAPIPFPTGGYRPPAAGYPLAASAQLAVERPPAAAPAVVPLDIPLAEAESGIEWFPRSSLRHRLGIIGSLIGIFFFVTVAATLLFVVLAPRTLGWQFVVVSGNSMEPTIHLGAIAVMKKVDPQKLKVGDIIMFTDPSQSDRAVTHRLVGVNDNGASFTTRGDANQALDAGTVPAQDVRGKFLFSIPEAGRVVRWMGSSQGYLMIILVGGGVLIFWVLRSLSRNRNKPPGTAGA